MSEFDLPAVIPRHVSRPIVSSLTSIPINRDTYRGMDDTLANTLELV